MISSMWLEFFSKMEESNTIFSGMWLGFQKQKKGSKTLVSAHDGARFTLFCGCAGDPH